MTASTLTTLQSLGMTGNACPVTKVLASNVARSFGEFSISYRKARKAPYF